MLLLLLLMMVMLLLLLLLLTTEQFFRQVTRDDGRFGDEILGRRRMSVSVVTVRRTRFRNIRVHPVTRSGEHRQLARRHRVPGLLHGTPAGAGSTAAATTGTAALAGARSVLGISERFREVELVVINSVKVGSGGEGLKIGRAEFRRTFSADFLGTLVLEPDLDGPEGEPDLGGESVDGRPARERLRDEDFAEDCEVGVRDACPLPASLLSDRVVSGEVGGLEMRVLK